MPVILPTKQRKTDLRYIHLNLLNYRETKAIDALAKACERMLKDQNFQQYIRNNAALQRPLNSRRT